VARRCVWSRNLENEEATARYRAKENTTTMVCNARKTNNSKQTTNNNKPLLTENIFNLVEVYIHIRINKSEVSDVYCVVRQFDICVSWNDCKCLSSVLIVVELKMELRFALKARVLLISGLLIGFVP
jgi:hypothetical protein